MARLTRLMLALALSLSAPVALAQTEDAPEEDPPADEAAESEEEALDEDEEELELDGDEDVVGEDEPALRAPSLEMPDVGDAMAEDDEGADEDEDDWAEAGEGTAEEDEDLLRQAEPEAPSADPTRTQWTAPQTALTLHGYFRVRGELQDSFFLGRDDVPFNLFTPADRDVLPEGGCRGGEPGDDPDRDACNGSDRLRFANMRLRLRPTIGLSDDVRVRMTIDVFDNLVLGSTPDGTVYIPPGAAGNDTGEFIQPARTPGVPIDSFAATQNPQQGYRNSLRDSIYVRHAWAEVTNRGLGQLRFGRMPSHWGLGVLANDGMGIDADQSSDVDRIMGLTRLAGIYIVAAWDFAAQGLQQQLLNDLRGVPFDASTKDDVRQYVFALARRTEPEEQQARLQRGSWVLNGGFYFVFRKQFLSTIGPGQAGAFPSMASYEDLFVRRNARAFIPDLWAQFLWGGLRLEMEAVYIAGEIENIENDSFVQQDFKIRQFGVAFEGEYRLLDDKLSIRLYTGYASGDADINGLSQRQGLLAQQTDNRTISHMQFHPNYRVDLILWRNILGRVAGAWYLKPGLSYDIIRNPFGQLFGIGADLVYSRAAQEVQTYGSDPNLGVELDFSVYYRSEDGPEMFDGFYMQFNYGVLFPLAGLGYASYMGVPENPRDDDPLRNQGLKNAQTLRLILGVQY